MVAWMNDIGLVNHRVNLNLSNDRGYEMKYLLGEAQVALRGRNHPGIAESKGSKRLTSSSRG
jgi:hypothetical protein